LAYIIDDDGLMLLNKIDEIISDNKIYISGNRNSRVMDKCMLVNVRDIFRNEHHIILFTNIIHGHTNHKCYHNTHDHILQTKYFKSVVTKLDCIKNIDDDIFVEIDENYLNGYEKLQFLLNDVTYLFNEMRNNNLSDSNIAIFKNICDDVLLIDKNHNDIKISQLIIVIYWYIDKINKYLEDDEERKKKHSDEQNEQNYCSENNSSSGNTLDDLMEKSQMMIVSKNRKYYKRMENENIIKLISERVHVKLDDVNERIEDIEENYIENLQECDSDMYKTILTMSNWIDELREGNCIGLTFGLTINEQCRKGKYDVILTNNTLSFGSTTEMFETLNKQSVININNNAIINGNVVVCQSNCIIPLYIHELHWSIAKEYLNPICNIILYNSIKCDNKSAWKLIYAILLNALSIFFGENGRIKLIKYCMSLWLTTFILSKEAKYDRSLDKFIDQLRFNKMSVDPFMIAGQIISIGCNTKKENINFIKKIIVEQNIGRIESDILDKINKTITIDELCDSLSKNNEILKFLFVLDVFIKFFETHNVVKISNELKKDFGILNNKICNEIDLIVKEFDAMNTTKNIIKNINFESPVINTFMNNNN
jgi:hypothetical protein